MGVQFTPGWQGPQGLPFNEKQVRGILQNAGGVVGFAASANNQDVTVTAGPHQGGRPTDPNPDMRWHITVQVPGKGTWHVALAGSAGSPRIIDMSQG
ncbi:MAG TPA: hypothetical protein V6D10_11380 [Trichocoleus sp.]|jgi:hypothetical protein